MSHSKRALFNLSLKLLISWPASLLAEAWPAVINKSLWHLWPGKTKMNHQSQGKSWRSNASSRQLIWHEWMNELPHFWLYLQPLELRDGDKQMSSHSQPNQNMRRVISFLLVAIRQASQDPSCNFEVRIEACFHSVSYTHLTLPTICSV